MYNFVNVRAPPFLRLYVRSMSYRFLHLLHTMFTIQLTSTMVHNNPVFRLRLPKLTLGLVLFFLLSSTGPESCSAFDPFSIGAVVKSYIGRFFGFSYMKGGYDAVRTMFAETCDRRWITPNMTGLHYDLTTKLHGQHVVQNTVLKKMRLHVRKDNPRKPLAMSFHGWTGGGKNFVSRMIVNNLYKEKEKSGFVHWFISSVHFPHKSRIEQYKDDLISWIRGNVSQCEHSIFIFDEVDKMPIGLLDTVKPFLDHYDNIQGVDFRKSIFLFLSNTGGTAITEKMLDHWSQGKDREDVKLDDFHEMIEQGAFNENVNEQGGLYRSSMIDRHLIDYYVPFLPLERKHVMLCARDAFREQNVNPTDEVLNKIADMIPYFPEEQKIFSKLGCKRIENKVNEYLHSDEL